MNNDSCIQTTSIKDRICLALDIANQQEILEVVDELKDLVGYFKLNSAFTLFGPNLVQQIIAKGSKVFLDLKLHDIPNTLSGYGDAVTKLGVHIVTVHVSGGIEMMKSLVNAADKTAQQLSISRPKFIGITLLTSISKDILNSEMNVQGSIQEEVLRKALLAYNAGLDGIVSSAEELPQIKPELPKDFIYVTPGVRAEEAGFDDHKRVATYKNAMQFGSSLLVVGRKVLSSDNRRAAVNRILEEIE